MGVEFGLFLSPFQEQKKKNAGIRAKFVCDVDGKSASRGIPGFMHAQDYIYVLCSIVNYNLIKHGRTSGPGQRGMGRFASSVIW